MSMNNHNDIQITACLLEQNAMWKSPGKFHNVTCYKFARMIKWRMIDRMAEENGNVHDAWAQYFELNGREQTIIET